MAFAGAYTKKKLYDVVASRLQKDEDPDKLRYVMVRYGYDESDVDDAIETMNRLRSPSAETTEVSIPTSGMTPTAKAIVEGKLDYASFKQGSTPTEVGVVRNELLKSGFDISGKEKGDGTLTDEGKRLQEKISQLPAASEREGAAGAIAAIKGSKDIERLITESGVKTGPVQGSKQKGLARLIDKDLKDVTDEEKAFLDFNAATTAFTANFIKAISGAQVSDKERQFLMNALPSIYKQEAENVQGMEQLVSFLENRYEFSLGESIDTDKLYTSDDVTKDIETPTEKSKEQRLYDMVQSNPDHPNAQAALAKLKEIGFLNEKNKPVVEASKEISAEASKETSKGVSNYDKVLKNAGPLTKLADKVGGFLGVKKFAQGMGVTIFLLSKEGKALQKKADSGDKLAIEAMQDILDETPTGKEVVGSAALTGLNVASVGLAKGATATSTIAKGSALGGAFGAAGGLEQDKDVEGIAKSTAIGATVGGVMSAAGVGYRKWREAKKAVRSDAVTKAVGRIVQGKKKDVAPALETLKRVDTKGVKTYDGLLEKVDDNMAALGDSMDQVLEKDKTLYKLEKLVSKDKVGKKTIETNYVERALKNLDELYTKANDPANAERVKQIAQRSSAEGITTREINDIAKEYGLVFGKKAFTKLGEPTTSVSGLAYENTRKGVKATVRNVLPGDKAKQIDKAFYENIKTRDLLDNVAEKVNGLLQRVDDRGKFEKVGRGIGKIAQKVPIVGTGGKGFLQAFIPSNAGNKTMNSLALQEVLKKNIAVIENNGEKLSQKIADRLSTGRPITNAFVQNLLRELSDDE